MRYCQQTTIPAFVNDKNPKVIQQLSLYNLVMHKYKGTRGYTFNLIHSQVQASPRKLYVSSSSAACGWRRHEECGGLFGQRLLWFGCERALTSSVENSAIRAVQTTFCYQPQGGLSACAPLNGWSNIIIPGIIQ